MIVTDRATVADFADAVRTTSAALGTACQKSEYVVWPDAQPGLARQFTAALGGLGFKYQLLDEDNSEGHVSIFRADKATQGLLGVWAESDGATVLAWCTLKSVQAAAPAPKPAAPLPPAPAKPAPAPTKPAQAILPPLNPKAGYAIGRVVTADGRPVSGAEVRVEGTNDLGGIRTFTAKTNASGYYEQRLVGGIYKVHAWAPRSTTTCTATGWGRTARGRLQR